MPTVTTRFPTDSDLDPARVLRLATLINAVYDAAEAGLWRRTGLRTDPAEVESLLRASALILAERDGVVIGCVKVALLGDGIGELGMLVADPAHRGVGVGSALMDHAERWARGQSCHTMQLELLTPRPWAHPSKEFLKAWYARLGYCPQTTASFAALFPALAAELATECDFTVWRKPLG